MANQEDAPHPHQEKQTQPHDNSTSKPALPETNTNEDEMPPHQNNQTSDQEYPNPSCEPPAASCDPTHQSHNFPSDLRDLERRALADLRSKLDEAIKANKLFKEIIQEENTSNEEAQPANQKQENNDQNSQDQKLEAIPEQEAAEEIVKLKPPAESVPDPEEITLWGVPLLPSKGDTATDVLLLKFLRAREFEVRDAFDMLRNTLQWRKENNVDAVLDEDFGNDFSAAAFMDASDREGHPVCYNVFGVLARDDTYNKALATEEKRQRFLRWRVQLMEKGIRQLELKPGGACSLLQVNDLRETPGPARKEVRLATKQAVALLQDNYPEFAAKNIFINVPFWYYAFAALFSPFLTPRTKSKFVYARPSRVTDTLLKYISVEQIPVQYGGLKRENDGDFSIEDEASEVTIKAGTTESIEIAAPQVGTCLIWDLTVVGWEVSYREEFVPDDETSYTVIVQRERKLAMPMQDEGQAVRNSFTNREPGKLLLVIHNSTFKKKRLLYRYKIHAPSSSAS